MTTAADRRGQRREATELPVAQVAVDVSLAHLDRPFDYLVPDTLAQDAQPGVRVRVRFAGRLVDGVVLDRLERSEHTGRLGWLERVVSPEPVVSPELAALCRSVAERYAGSFADVLRLALPPRHGKVEAEPPAEPAAPPELEPGLGEQGWGRYRHGVALLDAVRQGRGAHAVWQPVPGEDWPSRLAELASASAAAGRGALLVVPDQRDLAAVAGECRRVAGAENVVTLTADVGPAKRYRAWLAVRRGTARIVVGTRAAMFAPIADPGLLVVWDDGDDLHSEPRAPYPHTREVLVHRAHATGAAVLVAGFVRTAEAALLVESGWAREVVAERDTVRACVPRVTPVAETEGQLVDDPAARAARLPRVGFDAARGALTRGEPVLVQVPRGGYIPGLACRRCRETARCRHCAGPLGLPRNERAGDTSMELSGAPRCRWCGVTDSAYRCASCGSRALRATTVGLMRTAEEFGRAFPGFPVRGSGGGSDVLDSVPAEPALVVATPGAEPKVAGVAGGAGYGAALLLDGWLPLSRPELGATVETLRRWMAASTLVRSWREGGRVIVAADPDLPVVQGLVRWDPAGFAAAELAERSTLRFPPTVRMASLEGEPAALAELVETLESGELGDALELLGPVDIAPGPEGQDRERVLARVPRTEGRRLASALVAAQSVRSARKASGPVRVRMDPTELA
ncbi:MAG TPA: primosomal protein N' [Pseudonocardia sp.]|nr:primosomal protein N' [Pseudonocardia sp.]